MNTKKRKRIVLTAGVICVVGIGVAGGKVIMSATPESVSLTSEQGMEDPAERTDSQPEATYARGQYAYVQQDRTQKQTTEPGQDPGGDVQTAEPSQDPGGDVQTSEPGQDPGGGVQTSEPVQDSGGDVQTTEEELPSGQTSNETPRSEPGQIVYVGDSLLSGLDDYGIMEDVPDHKLLYKIGVGPFTFYNGSMMDQLLETPADRLYMLLGMNELDGSPSERQLNSAIAFYRKIIERYEAAYPDAVIRILALPPVRPNAAQKNRTILQFNKKLSAMAEDMAIDYLDVTEGLRGEDGYLAQEYSEPDGTHWNIQGCRQFLSLMESCE